MQLSLYQVALSLLLRVHVTVPGRREAMCGDIKPNYETFPYRFPPLEEFPVASCAVRSWLRIK